MPGAIFLLAFACLGAASAAETLASAEVLKLRHLVFDPDGSRYFGAYSGVGRFDLDWMEFERFGNFEAPAGIAYDGLRKRVLAATAGENAALYARGVDAGDWTLVRGLGGVQVAALSYSSAEDAIFALVDRSGRGIIDSVVRMEADGTQSGGAPLRPLIPYTTDWNYDQTAAFGDKLLVMIPLAPLPSGPEAAEFRTEFYLIDPKTGATELVGRRARGRAGRERFERGSVLVKDLDWKDRLRQVERLGRLGAKGLPYLISVLDNEPCRIVRMAAFQWTAQGPGGGRLAALSEDRKEPERLVVLNRAGLTFDPKEDLDHCLDADMRLPAERREIAKAGESGPAAVLEAAVEIVSAKPEPPAAPARVSAPSEAVNWAGVPENLPGPAAVPAGREPSVSAEARRLEGGPSGTPLHDAVPGLLAALKDKDARLRSRAVDELGKMGPAARTAVPAILSLLRDREVRVRSSAVLALGNIGPDWAVVRRIRPLLKDKNADVRFSARIALRRLGAEPRSAAALP